MMLGSGSAYLAQRLQLLLDDPALGGGWGGAVMSGSGTTSSTIDP